MSKQSQNKLLNDHFIKSVARAFAHYLLRYSENGGNMKNITAAKVYEFLEKLNTNEKGIQHVCQYLFFAIITVGQNNPCQFSF